MKVVLALADKNGNDFDEVSDGYTGYSGLEKALRDMNSQGVFAKSSVEVSAILEDDVATSIIINDKNAPETGVDNPTLDEDEFAPASWDNTANEIKLRYYQTPMTDSEIRDAIEDLLGEPVTALNKFFGYAELENGDLYPVDFVQIEVVAISFDGTVVDYPDKNVAAHLTGLPAGAYFDINENPTGVVGAPQLTVGADGRATVNNTSKDREFVTAYQINGIANVDDAELADGTAVNNGNYVAEGETLVLDLTDDYDYTIQVGSDVDYIDYDDSRTYEVEVTGTVTISAAKTEYVDSQSDLDSALANASIETIRLGDGVYEFTGNISRTGDLTIIGNGNTVIDEGTAGNGADALYVSCDDLTISGVTFRGNGNGIVTAPGAVDNVYIEDCTFEMSNMGVYLGTGVKGGYIRDCTFDMSNASSYVAIGLYQLAGDFTIEDNTFIGTGSVGVDIENWIGGAGNLITDATYVNRA